VSAGLGSKYLAAQRANPKQRGRGNLLRGAILLSGHVVIVCQQLRGEGVGINYVMLMFKRRQEATDYIKSTLAMSQALPYSESSLMATASCVVRNGNLIILAIYFVS
jgi:hypothetical protein